MARGSAWQYTAVMLEGARTHSAGQSTPVAIRAVLSPQGAVRGRPRARSPRRPRERRTTGGISAPSTIGGNRFHAPAEGDLGRRCRRARALRRPPAALGRRFELAHSRKRSLAPLCPRAVRFRAGHIRNICLVSAHACSSPGKPRPASMPSSQAGSRPATCGRASPPIGASPATRGRRAPLPDLAHSRARRALAARGIDELYAHQARGLRAGATRHATSWSPRRPPRGKSLCFHLPVLDSAARAIRDARALYLFPTKALVARSGGQRCAS